MKHLLDSKINFLKIALKKEFTEDKDIILLFKKLLKNESLLNKIHFSEGLPKVNFKYKVILDLYFEDFYLEVNGKKHYDSSLARSIIKLIEKIEPGSLCIGIVDQSRVIRNTVREVDYKSNLVWNLIMDAGIDTITLQERKNKIREQIEESLINKDKNQFEKLCSMYNEL